MTGKLILQFRKYKIIFTKGKNISIRNFNIWKEKYNERIVVNNEIKISK